MRDGWWRPASRAEETDADGDATPAWAVFAERAIRNAPGTTPIVRDGVDWQAGFALILRPFVTLAGDRMSGQVSRSAVDLPAVRADFEAQLGARLARLAARVLILELHRARAADRLAGDTPTRRFAAFIAETARRPALTALCDTFPVLARVLAQAGISAADAGTELLTRLRHDRDAIRALLLDGIDPGLLVEAATGAGDRHRGGRSVAVLRFADGRRIVYKPRALGIHTHFLEAVRWLAGVGADGPGIGTVVARDGYGWMGFIANKPCMTAEQVARFYRRQGVLLALLYALDATDTHMENLIARADTPIVVDLETLFHPVAPLPSQTQTPTDPAVRAIARSVYRTGLLPQLLLGDSAAVDLSGLGGDSGAATPAESVAFADAGTDRMRLVRVARPLAGAANRPTLNGITADPSEHAASIVDGFQTGYDAIAGHRDELVWLLDRFAGDEVRVVLRPTRFYATLLDESTHPDVMRHAADRDALFDTLRVGTEGQQDLTAAVRHEIEALWNGDVPVFTAEVGGASLRGGDGTAIVRDPRGSGLDRVRSKLRRLGPADRHRQEWVIRAALASRDQADPHHPPSTVDSSSGSDGGGLRDRLLGAATRIAEDLLASAETDGDRTNWLGLELAGDRFWQVSALGAGLSNGYTGVALFLGQLAAITGRADLAAAARRAVRPIPILLANLGQDPEAVAAVGPGGFAGFGGIAYAVTHLATSLDDAELAGWIAPAVTSTVDSALSTVDAEPDLGVSAGLAGGLAALLAIHEATGSATALTGARACAARLASLYLDATMTDLGFLNGRAGVDWALARSGAVSPATPPSHESGDLSWCGGWAGRAMAYGVPARHADIALLPDDCLCHGEFGLLEALASGPDGRAAPAYRQRLAAVMIRIEHAGPLCGTPANVPSPGLLTGLAGIGYGLLRAAFPQRVTSVLQFGPPMR